MEAVSIQKHTAAAEEYTVYVGDHRILTVSTDDVALAAKWTSEVSKSSRRGSSTVVAVSVNQHNRVLHLSTGCNTLLFHLPDVRFQAAVFRAFAGLLMDERVMVVGVGMDGVKRFLKEKWSLEVRNAVDLGAKAEELVPGTGKLILEEMSTVFLRKDIDLVDVKLKTHEFYSVDKVESATVDVYLAYAVGVKLIAAAKDMSLLSTFRWKSIVAAQEKILPPSKSVSKKNPQAMQRKYSLKQMADEGEQVALDILGAEVLLPNKAPTAVYPMRKKKPQAMRRKYSLKQMAEEDERVVLDILGAEVLLPNKDPTAVNAIRKQHQNVVKPSYSFKPIAVELERIFEDIPEEDDLLYEKEGVKDN